MWAYQRFKKVVRSALRWKIWTPFIIGADGQKFVDLVIWKLAEPKV